MSARALLAELRNRGVELVADQDRLQYRPRNLLTPELLDRLQANKPTLLKLLEWERRKLDEADRLGCVARWSRYPIWIELHYPVTGEWHEVRAAECLPGVVAEADKYREQGGAAGGPVQTTGQREGPEDDVEELRADLELGKLIHRQAEKNSASEKREELWAASVRAYHAKRGENLRRQWREHFKRMRAVHWGLGDEYDAKLKTLENEHEED